MKRVFHCTAREGWCDVIHCIIHRAGQNYVKFHRLTNPFHLLDHHPFSVKDGVKSFKFIS